MLRTLLVLAALLVLPAASRADDIAAADRAEFQRIITDQIEAFRADDGARAYSHAAPNIKLIFPTPEVFMSMVKQGYMPVYRPKSFKFSATAIGPNGGPTQRVTIVGPDGKTYEALYSMERQPDGTWRINGCALLEVPGLDV